MNIVSFCCFTLPICSTAYWCDKQCKFGHTDRVYDYSQWSDDIYRAPVLISRFLMVISMLFYSQLKHHYVMIDTSLDLSQQYGSNETTRFWWAMKNYHLVTFVLIWSTIYVFIYLAIITVCTDLFLHCNIYFFFSFHKNWRCI